MPTGMQLGSKLSIEDADLRGKRVLIRADFNVPLDEGGHISNNQRIMATLPTLQYALAKQAHSLVLMSHLGRPDGKVVPSMSLRPVASELGALLGREVAFLEDCVGPQVEAACASAPQGFTLPSRMPPKTCFRVDNIAGELEVPPRRGRLHQAQGRDEAKGFP